MWDMLPMRKNFKFKSHGKDKPHKTMDRIRGRIDKAFSMLVGASFDALVRILIGLGALTLLVWLILAFMLPFWFILHFIFKVI